MQKEMLEFKKRLDKVRAELDETLKEMRPLVRKAMGEGHTISHIALSLGVSRQTIYNILENES